jgi:hypothetical protein
MRAVVSGRYRGNPIPLRSIAHGTGICASSLARRPRITPKMLRLRIGIQHVGDMTKYLDQVMESA